MAVKPIDERAKKTLFNEYWTSKGWRGVSEFVGPNGRRPRAPHASPADLAYAKSVGLMFEPLTIGHDELVASVRSAAAALTRAQVRDAFLASLSTRRVDLRSALASYALALSLQEHSFQPDSVWCRVCGALANHTNEDLSVLSFERHKWGGVRHSQPIYQYVDLTALHDALPAKPEAADHAIWSRILSTIDKTPKADGPTKLSQRLADVLPSSKDERNTLLEILGAAGVLVPREKRSSPGEWSFVGMWRGEDGYDTQAVTRLFGAVSRPAKRRKRRSSR